MSKHLDAFVKEGLARYAEAYETIETFRDELNARLRRVLESREPSKFAPGKIRTEDGGRGAEGYWICAVCDGAVGTEDARLELGVWWNAPGAPAPAIVYAGFFDGPDSIRMLPIANGPRVRAFPHKKKRIYAVAAASGEVPVEELAAEVLDAVEAALETTRAP